MTSAGVELVRFAKSCGLIRGEWIVVDGTKFRAVSSIDTARERFQLQRYLDSIEKADEEQLVTIDPAAVQTALQKLKEHPEPEAGFMLVNRISLPAYNFQTAVDTKHALIVAHDVVLEPADNRCLQPMAEAVKAVLGVESFNVVADAGYSNGEQAAHCEAAGMVPYVPATRTMNPHGNGSFFQRTDFRYQAETDTYVCPNGNLLHHKATRPKYKTYQAKRGDCGECSIKSQCTQAQQRLISRHLYEEALDRMQERATPALMRLRKAVVEHPFAIIKYRIFGHPRLLLRGRDGARIETGLAVMAYNLKRMTKLLGAVKLAQALQPG